MSIYNNSGQLMFQENYDNDYILFEKDFSNILKSEGLYYVVLNKTDTTEKIIQKIIIIGHS
jgi:hypothetical protein